MPQPGHCAEASVYYRNGGPEGKPTGMCPLHFEEGGAVHGVVQPQH